MFPRHSLCHFHTLLPLFPHGTLFCNFWTTSTPSLPHPVGGNLHLDPGSRTAGVTPGKYIQGQAPGKYIQGQAPGRYIQGQAGKGRIAGVTNKAFTGALLL